MAAFTQICGGGKDRYGSTSAAAACPTMCSGASAVPPDNRPG